MADEDVEYSGIVFTVAVNRAAGGTPRMSNELFAKTLPEQRGDGSSGESCIPITLTGQIQELPRS